ncbi:MAG: aminoacetone oxidase family FAD-binding enzyme [Clostridiales bacterium]|nr:aminoacetone oxidase family FAD-binding enzyme [Clostridiales bacterium]
MVKQNVKIVTVIQILEISKKKNEFQMKTADSIFNMDKVILCCGSKASPKTGSDGSGYEYARKFGHTIVKPLPALVQVKCQGNYFKGISGVRTQANVSLFINGVYKDSDLGELQLTDYGISGIPVFQISRHIAQALERKEKVDVYIDFLPEVGMEQLSDFLEKRKNLSGDKTIEEFLCGIFQKKIIAMILKEYKLKSSRKIKEFSLEELEKLFMWIKKFFVQVIGTNSFEQAQICLGGVNVDEVDEKMQSKIVSGLYFAGEILDVDGKCGGYNLQWAWTSGYVAGFYGAKE